MGLHLDLGAVILNAVKDPCIPSFICLKETFSGYKKLKQSARFRHQKTTTQFTTISPSTHHVGTTQKPRKIPKFCRTALENTTIKIYLPSRNRAASRSGSPAIKILPCAAVRSYGTR